MQVFKFLNDTHTRLSFSSVGLVLPSFSSLLYLVSGLLDTLVIVEATASDNQNACLCVEKGK